MGLNSLKALRTLKSCFKGFQAIFKQMDLFLMFLSKLLPGPMKVETTIGDPKVCSVIVPSPLSVRLARSLLVTP
jgi:hypothetical protein